MEVDICIQGELQAIYIQVDVRWKLLLAGEEQAAYDGNSQTNHWDVTMYLLLRIEIARLQYL